MSSSHMATSTTLLAVQHTLLNVVRACHPHQVASLLAADTCTSVRSAGLHAQPPATYHVASQGAAHLAAMFEAVSALDGPGTLGATVKAMDMGDKVRERRYVD